MLSHTAHMRNRITHAHHQEDVQVQDLWDLKSQSLIASLAKRVAFKPQMTLEVEV